MRFLAVPLLMAGCVPIESTMTPVNIAAKTFRVELRGANPAGSGNPLDSVVLPVCPQVYKFFATS